MVYHDKELELLNELKILLNDKGYIIENIIYSKSTKLHKRSRLKVTISNKSYEPINIEDCKIVSKEIALVIDVKNLITEPYNLEVSSKGCEDSLFFIKDFINNIGKLIKVELSLPNKDSNIFYAMISSISGDKITLKVINKEINTKEVNYNKNNNLITVSMKNIKSAVLIKDRRDRSFNERTI